MATKLNLFCFPFAGGSIATYAKWNDLFPPLIEICPIELQGRGSRAIESLYGTFDELIDDVFARIQSHPDSSPYALFGYSMGGLVVYELYRKMVKMGYPKPLHLFISARAAPSADIVRLHHLPDKAFIDQLLTLDGMQKELYENKEMLRYFLPIIRADLRIHETYLFNAERPMIDCDLSVFYGHKDNSVSKQGIMEWSNFAARNCRFYEFPGGHFFIREQESKIADLITSVLTSRQWIPC